MKTIISVLCAGACIAAFAPRSEAQVASACDATSGNLVSNCGFETGSFSGWTMTGNDVTSGTLGNLYGVEGTDPVIGTAVNSGSDQAWFSDIVSNATTMSQTLATTALTPYTISFELAQVLEGPGTVNNSVAVSFGGTTLVTPTLTNVGAIGYTLFTYTAVATSASSVFSLKLGDDIGEFLLDDVTVTAVGGTTPPVPNPGNAWLMLSGLGVGALVLQRRRIFGFRRSGALAA